MFDKLIIFFFLRQLSQCKIVETPRSTYGVHGQQVILQCSVDRLDDRVDWFYKGVENKVEHLSRNTDLKSPFTAKNKMRILYDAESESNIKFYLLIRTIQLKDTGIYACSVSNNRNRVLKSVLVSVLNIKKCKTFYLNRTLAIRCQLEITGDVEFVTNWQCPVMQRDTGIRERNDTIKNLFYEDIRVRDQMIGVTVEYSPDSLLRVCSLVILALKYNGPRYEDTDLKTPFFEATVELVPMVVSEGTLCSMEKNHITNLKPNIVLDPDYSKKHDIPIQNLSGKYYGCLLPKNITKQLFMGSEFEAQRFASCETIGGMACMKNYTVLLHMYPSLIDLPAVEYNRICRSKEAVSSCLKRIQPCSQSSKLRGLATSFYFLCKSKFLSLTKNQVNYVDQKMCTQHYPQTMGNLHVKTKYVIGSKYAEPDDDSPTIDSFCRILSFFNQLFCVEHMIAGNGNMELSQWYLKFMTHMKQLDLSRFYESRKRPAKKILISECRSDSIDYIQEAECKEAEKCLALMGILMQTINFGFFYISNLTYFQNVVCRNMESDIKPCFSKFSPKCGIVIMNMYKPMFAMRRAICFGAVKTYQTHHRCFNRIYLTHSVQHRCKWGSKYNEINEKARTSFEKSAEICKMGMAQMECVVALTRAKCGLGGAKVQEYLLQVFYIEVFENLYCKKWFSFKQRLSFLKNSANLEPPSQASNYFVLLFFYLCSLQKLLI